MQIPLRAHLAHIINRLRFKAYLRGAPCSFSKRFDLCERLGVGQGLLQCGMTGMSLRAYAMGRATLRETLRELP